jgi:hypothetical protein
MHEAGIARAVAGARLCPSCAVTFDGIRPLDPCPTCGSPGLETPASEEIDLEILPVPVGA